MGHEFMAIFFKTYKAAHSSLLDTPGDDDDVIFHQNDQLFGAYDEEYMTDTIPLETTLMVHRGHALEDLIANV